SAGSLPPAQPQTRAHGERRNHAQDGRTPASTEFQGRLLENRGCARQEPGGHGGSNSRNRVAKQQYNKKPGRIARLFCIWLTHRLAGTARSPKITFRIIPLAKNAIPIQTAFARFNCSFLHTTVSATLSPIVCFRRDEFATRNPRR